MNVEVNQTFNKKVRVECTLHIYFSSKIYNIINNIKYLNKNILSTLYDEKTPKKNKNIQVNNDYSKK